jgi:enamine deaminase RidA (YjgF/YER057c/UK114 family)
VDGVVYLTDLANFPGMNAVYRTVVPAPYPARAAVEAGLVAPGGLVEIMLTAER